MNLRTLVLTTAFMLAAGTAAFGQKSNKEHNRETEGYRDQAELVIQQAAEFKGDETYDLAMEKAINTYLTTTERAHNAYEKTTGRTSARKFTNTGRSVGRFGRVVDQYERAQRDGKVTFGEGSRAVNGALSTVGMTKAQRERREALERSADQKYSTSNRDAITSLKNKELAARKACIKRMDAAAKKAGTATYDATHHFQGDTGTVAPKQGQQQQLDGKERMERLLPVSRP